MKNRTNKKIEFQNGLKDGIPIALGYFCVSFSLGIMVISAGMSSVQGTVMSLTNVTSAGEFAGIRIIAAGGTIAELILTQLIINLRYALMSLSLSQKLSDDMTLWQRFVIAFGNTDEIFAVAMGHFRSLTFHYMSGLILLPVIGWTAGTFIGAVAGNIMPSQVVVATGVALYGMFIAIVIPAAKKSFPVFFTAALAIIISCVIYFVPFFTFISDGMSIIISTVLAAGITSIFFPVNDDKEEK